jgi:hypothetical protein
MSTQAQVKNEAQSESVIKWTKAEALAVAKAYVPLWHVSSRLSQREMIGIAQRVLPESRQRSMVFNASVGNATNITKRLHKVWNDWAITNPNESKALLAAARRQGNDFTPLTKERIEQVEEPVVEAAPTPIAPATAPTVVLGPFEQAMSTMVEQAVERSVGRILAHQQTLIDQQTETIHKLMMALHDANMCYWDEDFKRTRLVSGEYIGDISGTSPAAQLEQVRVQRKRVLIVATNARGLRNTIESRFNGVDFTFEEGDSQKPFKAGDFYHLVLCNGTNRPEVQRKLVDMHGRHKVNFISGGASMMIDTIRKRLGI